MSSQVGLYWKETSEMNGLFDGFVLNIMVHLVDKLSGYWNARSYWRMSQVMGPELKSYGKMKPFGLWICKVELQVELWQRI